MTPRPPTVIGVGTLAGGDDAIGLVVAERLRLDATVLLSSGDPADLIAAWEEQDWVVLVDAVSTGARAGTVLVRELLEDALPSGAVHSSHVLGPSEAIEIGRAIDILPGRLTLVGIEGQTFDPALETSVAVNEAVDEAVATIRALLASENRLHSG